MRSRGLYLAGGTAIKLAAVAQRGAKKDLVDIYALIREHRPLPELVELYQRRYQVADVAHLLYALAYFDDADRQRLPPMLWRVGWRTVKAALQHWTRELT